MKNFHWVGVLCLAAIMPLGCGAQTPHIGGVSGIVEHDGRPLPERTSLTFRKPDSESAFIAYVDGNGHYNYTPASGVPLPSGKYKIALTAPGLKTIQKDGVTIVDPNAKAVKLPVDKKYQNLTTTPLEVDLNDGSVVFDIKL